MMIRSFRQFFLFTICSLFRGVYFPVYTEVNEWLILLSRIFQALLALVASIV